MRTLFAFIVTLFCAASLQAAGFTIRASITFTNFPTNGATITIQGSARTWTNDITSSPGTLITQTNSPQYSATNLLNHLTTYPAVGGHQLVQSNATNVTIRGKPNEVMTVTSSGGYVTVQYFTNTLGTPTVVMVAPRSTLDATNRQFVAQAIIDYLSLDSTNAIATNAVALTNYLSTGPHPQRVIGVTTFHYGVGGTNSGLTNGVIIGARGTNLVGLNGTIHSLTNGTLYSPQATNAILDRPFTTNLINYGSAISSPGSGSNSEQFGTGAQATNTSALAVGNQALAGGDGSVAVGQAALATNSQAIAIGPSADADGYTSLAIGSEAVASVTNSIAIGTGASATHHNSIAIGVSAATTEANQLVLGSSTVALVQAPGRGQFGSLTNNILTGTNKNSGDWSDTMSTDNTLANGDNTPAFTGRVVRWTAGPSAAFSISGFTGQPRDGQEIDRINLTGQLCTLNNESGTTGSTNRILTLRGTNVIANTNAYMVFKYSSTDGRWLLKSLQPGAP
jgi:hypothetical protein